MSRICSNMDGPRDYHIKWSKSDRERQIVWNKTNSVNLFSSVQSLSHVQLFATPCSTPGFPVHLQLPALAQTHVHHVSDAIHHLILCRPLLLPPSVFPSIRVFPNESALPIRWPKYYNVSFNIRPSSEYLGFISFKIHWLDLRAVQGTLKSLLQHHSSKASTLRRSAFFIVQLTSIHDHWKNHSFD